MAVLDSVVQALDAADVDGYLREIAEALAAAMDDSPNASTAKELKALMLDLVGEQAEVKADVGDELASKRAARRAAAS